MKKITCIIENRAAIERMNYLILQQDVRPLSDAEKIELDDLTYAIDEFETTFMNLD